MDQKVAVFAWGFFNVPYLLHYSNTEVSSDTAWIDHQQSIKCLGINPEINLFPNIMKQFEEFIYNMTPGSYNHWMSKDKSRNAWSIRTMHCTLPILKQHSDWSSTSLPQWMMRPVFGCYLDGPTERHSDSVGPSGDMRCSHPSHRWKMSRPLLWWHKTTTRRRSEEGVHWSTWRGLLGGTATA